MRNFALISFALLLVPGCVVNFKSEVPKKGIIHVDIHYVYPGKCELNTFAGTYKKETAVGRYAETKIELDPGQQLLVLNHALVLHFFQMPESFTHPGGEESNAMVQSLRIKADSLDRTISWHGSLAGLRPEKYHVQELVEYIDSIVHSTDEYQGLPKSTLTGN